MMRIAYNDQEKRIWEIAFATYDSQLLIDRTRKDAGSSAKHIELGRERDILMAHLHADMVVMDYRKLKAQAPHAGKEGP